MNKKSIFVVVLLVTAGILGYLYYKKSLNNSSLSSSGEYFVTPDNYVGSQYKGNYVWGGAMNLAWNDLIDSVVNDQIKFISQDSVVQGIAEKFNSKPFMKSDLDEKSYYIKSGFGQQTVTEINSESKKKFPSKSFADLDIKLKPQDIIAYAYFLKQVEFLNAFEKGPVNFNSAQVEGFSAKESSQYRTVQIIEYWNDDKFILTLGLKDSTDQLIVAKGFDMAKPQAMVQEINNQLVMQPTSINSDDLFEMPILHLDYHRTYPQLEQQVLADIINGHNDYKIDKMFENIKFDLDEKGARVENEAVITVMTLGAVVSPEVQPKKLLLNKPFWVIMKRTTSKSPYFILGINNTELMKSAP